MSLFQQKKIEKIQTGGTHVGPFMPSESPSISIHLSISQMMALRKSEMDKFEQNGLALKAASNASRMDAGFVMAAVKNNGLALEYALGRLSKNDPEIVLAAVKQNGLALEYASYELKKKKKCVLAAVKQNGLALKYADDTLKNELYIVQSAVLNDSEAFQYASDHLQKDKDMCDFYKKATKKQRKLKF